MDVTRKGKPVAELIPAVGKGTLLLSSGRGTLLTESDDWWRPMKEDELEDWYGR